MSFKPRCAASSTKWSACSTRVAKLDAHFKIAQEDVDQIITSAGKIARRGTRIDRMDFSTPVPEISEEPFDKAAE